MAKVTVKTRAILTFGRYHQSGLLPLAQPIEWIVLGTRGESVLLISRYALARRNFHDEESEVTWEACSLRAWLNSEFLNKAFSAEERRRIETVSVTAEKNGYGYDSDPGRDTRDKVFLLNIQEAQRFMPGTEERICMPTRVAIKQGVDTDKDSGACWWWLRASGYNNFAVSGVYSSGAIDGFGVTGQFEGGVRPVILATLG